MRNKYAANHVLLRDGVFYYVRRVPLDLAEYYSVKRLCFSLRTKSYKSAIHASKSVSQITETNLLTGRFDVPEVAQESRLLAITESLIASSLNLLF